MSAKRRVYIYFLDINEHNLSDKEEEKLFSIMPSDLYERCASTGAAGLALERKYAYTLLCVALKKHGINPKECKVLFDLNGKPYIKNEEIEISISHTNGVVIVALSFFGASLGIDGEMLSCDNEKMKQVSRRFFADVYLDPYEISDYMAADDAQQNRPPAITLRRVNVKFELQRNDFYKSMDFYEEAEEERIELMDRYDEEISPLARYMAIESPVAIFKGEKLISGIEYGEYMRWCCCEAVLKADGRGFGALGDLIALVERATLYSGYIRTSENFVQLALAVL